MIRLGSQVLLPDGRAGEVRAVETSGRRIDREALVEIEGHSWWIPVEQLVVTAQPEGGPS